MAFEKAVNAAKARIRLLHRMLSQSTDPVGKTLARFCCETGVSMYTARKYLRLLIQAGLVEHVEEEAEA